MEQANLCQRNVHERNQNPLPSRGKIIKVSQPHKQALTMIARIARRIRIQWSKPISAGGTFTKSKALSHPGAKISKYPTPQASSHFYCKNSSVKSHPMEQANLCQRNVHERNQNLHPSRGKSVKVFQPHTQATTICNTIAYCRQSNASQNKPILLPTKKQLHPLLPFCSL